MTTCERCGGKDDQHHPLCQSELTDAELTKVLATLDNRGLEVVDWAEVEAGFEALPFE